MLIDFKYCFCLAYAGVALGVYTRVTPYGCPTQVDIKPGWSAILMPSNPVQHAIINWTQSHLRFCKMKGEKDLRLKKRGSIRSKIKEKMDTKCLKLLNDTFW